MSKTTTTSTINATSNASIAVGLNDTVTIAAKGKKTPVFETAVERINALVSERENWEQGAFVKSNEQLYAVLDKCYTFYFDLCGNGKEAKSDRVNLEVIFREKGYRFNEGTHMLTKLIKFVFDSMDRRRVSAYSLVLRQALALKIEAGHIPQFISDNGGVEEIRRSGSPTAKTPKQKAELGKQVVCEQNLAAIQSDTLKMLAEQADKSAGDDLLAILTMQDDGTFVIRALVNNKGVLNAALGCAYSANKLVAKTDSGSAKAANDDKAMGELMDAAAEVVNA